MRTKIRWFFAGIITSLLLVALVATAYAAYHKTATLYYNDISVTLDGKKLALKDANGAAVDPFIVEGTTYLPIRAVANALNINVDWNGQTSTVILKSPSGTSATPTVPSTATTHGGISTAAGTPAIINPKYPLHLYSNDGKVYLGKLVTDIYDRDGIWNEYGNYGSQYKANSIWNTFQTYGSPYSRESAFNDLASAPPKIVDNNGNFFGYLTTNSYKQNAFTIEQIRQYLINNNQ